MRRLMCVLALLVPLTASGQIRFELTYGGLDDDAAESVVQTSDGGYILAGGTGIFDDSPERQPFDIYVIKTDEWGDTVWTRVYGGPGEDWSRSVIETGDGGYLVAGWTDSFGAGGADAYLLEIDSSGDTVWTRTYGGVDYDNAMSVAQTNDGGYIISGSTYSFGAGSSDLYLIKTDSDADTMWTRSFGGAGHDNGASIAQTLDGGYIVVGITRSFGAGGADVYLIKTDSSGDTVWTRTYGGLEYDSGASVAQTLDGGYIIVGNTSSFGAGGADVYLLKTDSSGDTVWTRTHGGSADEYGYSVAQTSDGTYIIAGFTYSLGAGGADVYLLKTDSSGDTIWTRTYGGSAEDVGNSVAQTSDGGYIVAGYTYSFGAGGYDVYLIKTDANGWVQVGGQNDEEPGQRLAYLRQNRPNPFGGVTTISYAVPDRGRVSLAVYDIRGALVRELVSGAVSAGLHQVVWDGRDGRGRVVGSGVYFCRLEAGELRETRRMVLLR